MKRNVDRSWILVAVLLAGPYGCGGGSTVKAPVITAPIATLHTSGSTLAIDVDVVDPKGLPLTVTWTRVSGPMGVQFATVGIEDATVTFAANGLYQLRISASNGSTSSTMNIAVDVADPAPFSLSTEVWDGGSAAVGIPIHLHWSPVGVIASDVTDTMGRIAFPGLIGRKDRFQLGIGP